MNNLKDFKILTSYFNCTSEKLFNISEQLEAQCPTIDGMIKDSEDVLREVAYVTKYSDEISDNVSDVMENVKYYLSNVSDDFEKLRESIIEIRAWGQEWKNLAKYLMETMPVNEVLDQLNLDKADYDKLLKLVNEDRVVI